MCRLDSSSVQSDQQLCYSLTRKSCYKEFLPGCVAQAVTCLATYACLTADPEVARSIPARYHTFVEIDREKFSTVILLPSTDSFKKGFVSYKQKYVHDLLVNSMFKPAQEKVWLGELTFTP